LEPIESVAGATVALPLNQLQNLAWRQKRPLVRWQSRRGREVPEWIKTAALGLGTTAAGLLMARSRAGGERGFGDFSGNAGETDANGAGSARRFCKKPTHRIANAEQYAAMVESDPSSCHIP